MLRTELKEQASVVIAVVNSMSTYYSFQQFKVSSYSCVEVSQDEFVFGVNLLQEVMLVALEDLFYSSFSLQSWYVHTDDSGRLVVMAWES